MNERLLIRGCPSFDLEETLHCGQAFRWSHSDPDGFYSSVILGRSVSLRIVDGNLEIFSENACSLEREFREYFDLDFDYEAVKKLLSSDPFLSQAISEAPGIRILRQDPWETLGSFIFSANNNISRISGIIARFCDLFGKPAAGGGHCFPSPETVAALSPDDLAPLRCGYRDKYILDAAQKVADKTVSLDFIASAPIEEARRELLRISGVGPKVAECVLLFGFHRLEAFPVDVHIKEAMLHYPDGLPSFAIPYAGIAQQYLFRMMLTSS